MPFNGLLAYELNSQIASLLWTFMQWVFEHRHSALVTFSGDVIPPGENAIIIANHVSYSDFYLINGLALRKGMLPYCRWFAKSSLKWQLPIFGMSMYLIGMVMVTRDWLRDSRLIRSAFHHLKTPLGTGKRVWLVMFLEGTRKTDTKLLESQKFCESRGKPLLKHVLAPRTKGFVAAVQELRGTHVTHVYDLTLAYHGPKGFGHASTLTTVHALRRLTPPYLYHLHVRRWALSDLPKSNDQLTAWAERVWLEKDQTLEGLKNEWIDWDGLVGQGSLTDSNSGAYGVYRDSIW
ncbi:hypothetical protein CROQUDRAFT_667606 [Cronartium quercuum f. sp. fusiforme G11]|uniref:Phospholipid/glycerol acyltransferase domain-containing protein n=1 Tax=Cronartium quercuum f. sp. fusiforme G11 TaxID=708437 RepID=A0A9P6NUK1_9BASI|nr:hypothetical protein CROQUDRAFT_667606 [Cronartium quercuum f. sp. fusiforme G11]